MEKDWKNTKRCWCGASASYLIKNRLPNAEIVTFTCAEHRDETFNAIKWKLVADGTWVPGCLTWED